MKDSILIVGRGRTALGYDYESWRGPIMAVSSGIFVRGLPMPEHFVTLDDPKYFLGSLQPEVAHTWSSDAVCEPWPFWSRAEITKHVLSGRIRRGYYRTVPLGVIDMIPEKHRDTVKSALVMCSHELGFQPQWGDYPNVRGWDLLRMRPLNFSSDGPFGLDDVNNSLLYAIQVAARIGYRRQVLVGVELTEQRFVPVVDVLRKRVEEATEHGIAWELGTPSAALDFLPTYKPAPAQECAA